MKRSTRDFVHPHSFASIWYDAYGRTGGDEWGRFRYTGQMWQGRVRAYYYKARFYHPKLGRFMQADPIGYGDGMNMYGYVGGDPVNYRDPWGLFGLDDDGDEPVDEVYSYGRSIDFYIGVGAGGGVGVGNFDGDSFGNSNPFDEVPRSICNGIGGCHLVVRRQISGFVRNRVVGTGTVYVGGEFTFVIGTLGGEFEFGRAFDGRSDEVFCFQNRAKQPENPIDTQPNVAGLSIGFSVIAGRVANREDLTSTTTNTTGDFILGLGAKFDENGNLVGIETGAGLNAGLGFTETNGFERECNP